MATRSPIGWRAYRIIDAKVDANSGVCDTLGSPIFTNFSRNERIKPIRREKKSSAIDGRFAAQRAAGTQCRHMVSNIAVTITGNRAAASAYLLVLISKNHRSLPPGRYACELIKEDTGQ